MDHTETFNVICNGQIKPGYDSQQVQENFAELLKISVDKAKAIVGTKRTLKKNLAEDKARLYKQKLEDIGLVVTLKSNGVPAASGFTLALEPTEEELTQQRTQTTGFGAATLTGNSGLITCPKCGLEQEKTEECAGCGVIIRKVLARESDSETSQVTPASKLTETAATVSEEAINPLAIAAAAVAALVGAGLWMIIAVVFGYEHSLVALIVGSAVGFAAYSFGGRGQISGVICAGLTLIAIFAGKYYAYDSFQNNWASLLSEELQGEGFEEVFAEEIELAKVYTEQVYDDDSLRQFMVDNEYTEAFEPGEVDTEELQYFKDYVDPSLRSLASGASFEEWIQATMGAEMENLSTFDLMKEDFGILDVVFLFFGLGAAFRLGSGQHKTS